MARTSTRSLRKRRIIVKVGTDVIMRGDGTIALGRIYGLVESIAALKWGGVEVVLVSSGAIGLGAQRLSLLDQPTGLPMKQACAAVGQSRLMALYDVGFERLGITTAQVLLTEDDFATAHRYKNLRSALNKLLELGTLPIINENDVISTLEIERPAEGSGAITVFGDNNTLAALVAKEIGSDLLLILSDDYTLFSSGTPAGGDPPVVWQVAGPPASGISAMQQGEGAHIVTNVMHAGRIAADAGTIVAIANSRAQGVIEHVFSMLEAGTLGLKA